MMTAAERSSEGRVRPVGVVIPAHGHPQFLAEAIISACEQDYPAPVHVVVVDDQCRFEDTARVSADLLAAYPGRLSYLRQKNTRLPGARNSGIRFLLDLEPDLDAIFFLDADNRLTPMALRRFRAELGDDPAIGWAYPDIAFFGLSRVDDGVDIRETAPDYSVLKHLNGNISEAGSMVRADVFRAGVLFDETMKFGLEDWDFWLSAVEAGYRGRRVRDCGFLYRRRPESMIADSQRLTTGWLDRLRAKHASLLSPKSIVRFEHEEAPAFAVWLVDRGEFHLTSDPYDPGRVLSFENFTALARRWLENPDELFFPTHIFALEGDVWDAVRAGSNMLRYLFWRLRNEEKSLCLLKLGRARTFRILRNPAPLDTVHLAVWATRHMAERVVRNRLADPAARQPLVKSDCTGGIWAQTSDSLRASTPFEDLPGALDRLLAAIEPVPFRRFARSRRYAGPSASKVREDIKENLSLTGHHHPYPCLAGQGLRNILAARPGDMKAAKAAAILSPLVGAMRGRGNLVLAAEGDDELDLAGLDHVRWLHPLSEIIPQHWSFSDGDHAIYLGRRLSIRSATARMLSIPFQQADTVVVAGGIGSLEVLGSTKHYGARCFVLLDERLPSFAADPGAALHAILAMEHAMTAIWVGQEWIRDRLVANGIPAAKIIPALQAIEDAFGVSV